MTKVLTLHDGQVPHHHHRWYVTAWVPARPDLKATIPQSWRCLDCDEEVRNVDDLGNEL